MSDFVTNCFWKWQGSREEKQKKNMILGQFVSFSNFSNFSKFRNRFWYQRKKKILINYQHFWSYATFLLKFWHALKQTGACRYNHYNAVTPGILFHVYLQLNKVLKSKSQGSWVPRGLRVLRSKTCYYFENIINS